MPDPLREAGAGAPAEPPGQVSAAGDADGAVQPASTARRGSRRARRPAPEGSDPAPYDPPTEARSDTENDARLRADKPPHWG